MLLAVRSHTFWLALLSVGCLVAPKVRADDASLAADEKLLREHRVGTDDAALLALLRKRSPGPDDLRRIETLVRQLGSRSFLKREQASRALIGWGRPALAALRKAVHDPDAEVARRAKECIAVIEREPGAALPLAAVHLLAARKVSGAVPALLAYLPFADDETTEEEVLAALLVLSAGDRSDPALLAALKDPLPARRAAAGYVLGRHPRAEQRSAAGRLLEDRVPVVRFRAAQGLLAGREKAAVPALIGLLADAPEGMRWRVEDLLTRLAGERAPAAPDEDGEAARKKWRGAWSAWWAKHGPGLDLAKLPDRPVFLNLTLVPEMHADRVWEFGPDGKVRWEIKGGLGLPIDAQVLPNGRVLVAELHGNRVSERDRRNRVVWEHRIKRPIACQRLANGNTFIGTNHAAIIVTPAGKEVFRYEAGGSYYIHSIQLRPDGHIVCVSMAGEVRDIDPRGRVVCSVRLEGGSWSGIEGLPGNRYLVVGSGRVREIDATGRVRWKLDLPSACYATRLPNGNTLVVDNARGLVEVDRAGKRVWEKRIQTNLWRVHRR